MKSRPLRLLPFDLCCYRLQCLKRLLSAQSGKRTDSILFYSDCQIVLQRCVCKAKHSLGCGVISANPPVNECFAWKQMGDLAKWMSDHFVYCAFGSTKCFARLKENERSFARELVGDSTRQCKEIEQWCSQAPEPSSLCIHEWIHLLLFLHMLGVFLTWNEIDDVTFGSKNWHNPLTQSEPYDCGL